MKDFLQEVKNAVVMGFAIGCAAVLATVFYMVLQHILS